VKSNPNLTQPVIAARRTPTAYSWAPNAAGATAFVVLVIWCGAVITAIVAGVFAGDGLFQLALLASIGAPIAVLASVTTPRRGCGTTC
jgi:hypothetical protein